MWLTAAQVNDALLTTGMGVLMAAVVSMLAWMLRELYRLARVVERLEERTLDHERRLNEGKKHE